MTSVSTFACLQMLALRDVSPALNCQLPVHRARMAVHFSAGRALENLGTGLANTALPAGMDTKSIP